MADNATSVTATLAPRIEEPRICEVGGSGILFPIGGDAEQQADKKTKVLFYFFGLVYCFIGVSIVADMFMSAIERITSEKRRVRVAGTTRHVTLQVWNDTVANLTLMALGSSAPEIMLSINDISKRNFYAGDLGPSTIVGSAAFNLFCIIAVCINAIPNGETRQIREIGVYIITAFFSVFAYLWLLFIVQFNSKDVITVSEGVITFMFFPLLVSVSYLADVGVISRNHKIKANTMKCFVRDKKGCCGKIIRVCCRCLRHKKGVQEEDEDEEDGWTMARQCSNPNGTASKDLKDFRNGMQSTRSDLKEAASMKMAPTMSKPNGDETDDLMMKASASVMAAAQASRGNGKVVQLPEDHRSPLVDEDGEPIVNEAGIITFPNDSLEVRGGESQRKFAIPVYRKNGSEGVITCKYRMEQLTATPGYDYVEEEGEVKFRYGHVVAEIKVKILPKEVGERDDQFQIVLDEATNGAIFNPQGDGGAFDKNILTVIIRNDNKGPHSLRSRLYHMFDSMVNMDEIKLGTAEWREQIVSAFYCNGSAEEQESAGAFDWIMHLVFFPWSMFYAIATPPPVYLGGWVCFFASLLHIAVLTIIVGDLAEMFGCSANIKDNITAITVVALGTSVPDLFASKTAAQQDETADASIVNVTGSNSVNVFLGIGLPWMMAAIYWRINGADADWVARYPSQAKKFPDGAFVVESGSDLAFSVVVFTLFAMVCLCVIGTRRMLFKGELGGDPDMKACSSFLLFLLWVFYIGLSIWKSETPGSDDFAKQAAAIGVVVPLILVLMVLFVLLLQVLKISRRYIGEESFWGIFVAFCVIAVRMLVFVWFQL
mmetsp:Transcript_50166/g.119435  ORF Transcript_50166/g.119435 Transcript_50166/m.119435 type:complete len:827 (-) Transcript_50166:82-2562(-)